ncbi:hypothetical protein [Streptomyces soliscabiei]|uniref:hypothetical protein n=1 Tax=Streptomyces soliscabiei TaxID=588897 RepID=UPI0029A9F581|nr:hypothetical protein [Streptomyces sp. NY05-11A]MDX2682329.1 hypothetical protein [Streptomyces sp. NY05-11A]
MAADPSEYESSMPIVAAHMAKIERAVDRTRASHAGQPYAAVHQALVEALQDEDAQRVVPQVIEELARHISETPASPRPDIHARHQRRQTAGTLGNPRRPHTPSI